MASKRSVFRSVLKTLLGAASSLLPAAAVATECPDPTQFRVEVLKLLQREFPEEAAHPGPGDVIEAGGVVFRLDNLRKLVCASPRSDPKERERSIREHFQKGFLALQGKRGGTSLDWASAQERVVVQLVPEDLASRLKMLRRPLVPGVAVVVVLDLPTAYGYLGEEHLARWGVSQDALFDQAVRNLTRRTRGEMRALGEGANRVLVVGELDGYDAARILTPGLRKAAASVLGDPFRASIPNRDFLVMWGRNNQQLAREASSHARRDFETRPYPISPLVLEIWADGRVTVVPPSDTSR